MAITKAQVLDEMKALHQLFNDGQRRLFALLMQVQNMPEAQARTVTHVDLGLMSSAEAAGAVSQIAHASVTHPAGLPQNQHPQDRSGHTPSQATAAAAAASAEAANASSHQVLVERPANEQFSPQFNTQDIVNTTLEQRFGKIGGPLNNGIPQGEEVVGQVLENAKDLLRQVMKDANLPDNVLGMIDRVGVSDLVKRQQAPQTPAGPTEVVEEPSPLMTLVGTGSVFCQHLSGEVIRYGIGEIKPKFIEEVKKYAQDALRTEISTLKGYPTGFYTNTDTKAMQFFVKTDQFLAVVDGLPSEVAPLHIHFLGGDTAFQLAQNLLPSEQKLIHAKLDAELAAMVLAARVKKKE